MEDEPKLVVARETYVEETPHRAADMVRSLMAMHDDYQLNTDRFRHQLHEQAQASRNAKFDSIVRLCHTMEECLDRMDNHLGKSQLDVAVSSLIEACKIIAQHADTVAGVEKYCENETAST
jgi:chemotaxis protein histidine kinase CheA